MAHNPNEYTFGNVDDLPGADYLQGLDLVALAQQNALAPKYSSLSIIDAPGVPHALIRADAVPGVDIGLYREHASKALQHFGVLRAAGITIPDHRRIILEQGRHNQEYPEMYSIVRRIGGIPLPDIVYNRATHTRRVVEALSQYHVWALTSGETDVILGDFAKWDNITIEKPSDPESVMYAHDIDPYLFALKPDKDSDTRGLEMGPIIDTYDLSRRLRRPPKSARHALRLAVPIHLRLLKGAMNLVTRTEYEHDELPESEKS